MAEDWRATACALALEDAGQPYDVRLLSFGEVASRLGEAEWREGEFSAAAQLAVVTAMSSS